MCIPHPAAIEFTAAKKGNAVETHNAFQNASRLYVIPNRGNIYAKMCIKILYCLTAFV